MSGARVVEDSVPLGHTWPGTLSRGSRIVWDVRDVPDVPHVPDGDGDNFGEYGQIPPLELLSRTRKSCPGAKSGTTRVRFVRDVPDVRDVRDVRDGDIVPGQVCSVTLVATCRNFQNEVVRTPKVRYCCKGAKLP